jgi:predicted dehydrogenase
VDSLQREREPPVPPREALVSLELVLALYRSAASATAVELPLDAASALV